jgi:hypothetical protein
MQMPGGAGKGMYGGPKKKPISLNNQAGDEYGLISGPAASLSSIASRLEGVPVVGPYAMATKLAADGVGAIAKLFGYSRPVMLPDETCIVRPQPVGSMANASGQDPSYKLTYDPKQETAIDSRLVGGNGADEMSFQSLYSRESYMGSFAWEDTDAPEAQLAVIGVTPALIYGNGGGAPAGTYWLLPTTLPTLPFGKWRGTMHYRVRIVASAFHKGRLRISYEPRSATTLPPDTSNVVYSQIVDLEDSRDVTFCVDWAQPVPYRSVTRVRGLVENAAAPTWTSDDVNGTIHITVINRLTAPLNRPVEVLVFASGSDMHFREPVDCPDWTPYIPSTPPAALAEMQSEKVVDEQVADTNAPIAQDHRMITPQAGGDENLEKVFYADPVESFRTLFKRYTFHRAFCSETLTMPTGEMWEWTYDAPVWPFTSSYGFGFGEFPSGLAAPNDKQNVARATFMGLIAPCYLYRRGGIRHKFALLSGAELGEFISVSRHDSNQFNNAVVFVYNSGTSVISSAFAKTKEESYMNKGGTIAKLNSIGQLLEVEFPFYSRYRGLYTGFPANYDEGRYDAYSLRVPFVANDTPLTRFVVNDYVAAAEDFSLMVFLFPAVYYDTYNYLT